MATNTAASLTTHTGNGSTNAFSISFSFLADNEIDVTVAGVTKTLGTHYTISGSTITFTSGNTPANGAAIKFQRDTDISAKKVDFSDGSVLTEADLDANSDQIIFAQQEITDKLAGIEEGATADQTDAEIRTAVENASDSNVFTDADHSKLNAIEAGATGDQTASEIRTLVESASDSNVFTDADHSKLNGIESGATADQTNAEIRAAVEAASDSNVFTDADHTKLNGIETGATADQSNAEIRAAVEAASDSNVFTDADHSKLNAIEANATQDQTAGEIKTLYESNSDTNALTDAEKTVINGVTANTTELNKLDGYTGSTADLNITSGMVKQTTITNSDSAFPTSGAVVDFVANQIAPVGGLEVIPDEDSFPATQPVSGVVISIANIDGLIVNSSGVASNARTVGSGSDNVTINNFPASLRSKTMAAELGLLVSSTGASQIYNYHKLLAKEADVEQLSNDINDFAARYRVGSSNPTSDLDAGDLFYNTSTNKLLVYNATNSAWEETQSIGNFFISTLSPAFDGSTQNFTVTNAPANAQQILLSINGVIQKPNAGTSTPSEGFALDGSTIKLAAAPASGSDSHVVVLGSTVNIGTPSNNTVTSAMIVDGSIVNSDISPSAAIEGTKITPTINKPIQHLYTGNTITFTVTVASKDATHRYNGTGSGNGYKIDGKFAPYLKLIAGITYRFDQSDSSNSGHPLRFYLEANKTTAYTTNVTTNGTAGSSGAYTQILITDTTPATLHYQCSAHGYMGNSAETGGLVATDLVNDTSPQLGGDLQSNSNNIKFADNDKAFFGNSNDLTIEHNSSGNGIIANSTGQLRIQGDLVRLMNSAGSKVSLEANVDGNVELYYDNSKKFETTSTGATFSGTSGSHTEINILGYENKDARLNLSADEGDDNADKWRMVASVDGNFYLQNYTSGSWEWNLRATGNAAVELYYDHTKKFETLSNGASVTGDFLGVGTTSKSGYSDRIICVNRDAGSGIELRNNAASTGQISFSRTSNATSDAYRGYIQYSHSTDTMLFGTVSSPRVEITSNGHLQPHTNNTYDLGTSSKRWRNVYTNDLNLSNEGGANDVDGTWGSYTIQEGAEDLFLINKRNGKKYKFNLTEVK